jgi:hypothetical protein
MGKAVRAISRVQWRTAVALVAVLGLAAGMRVALVANAPAFITVEDSQDFFTAAYGLVQGDGFDLPLKRAPLYPLFLAGVTALFGPSLEAAVVVQHLLGLLTVACVFGIGTLVFGRSVGLLAACWVGVNGSLLTMEHTIIAEALFAPLLALAALVVLTLGRRESAGVGHDDPRVSGRAGALLLCLLAGLILGLGALTRSAAQAILPLAALGVVAWARGWRLGLLALGSLALGYGLVVGPWIARNAVVHGVATLSGGMGDALFTRTHRHDTTFTYRDRQKGNPSWSKEHRQIRSRVFELAQEERYSPTVRGAITREFGLTPAQADGYLREVALQVISQEPERYVRGTAAMFVKLGLGFERGFGDNWEPRFKQKFRGTWPEKIEFVFLPPGPWPDDQRAITEQLLSFYRDARAENLVAILFLIGTVSCSSVGRRGVWLLPAIVLAQLLVYVAMDGPLPRYRYALQPLITVVATAGAATVISQLSAGCCRLRRWSAGTGQQPAEDPLRIGVTNEESRWR